MKFMIPINERENGGSQTVHIVETDSDVARTNKKKLREYFVAAGYPPELFKRFMKEMGFKGSKLGRG